METTKPDYHATLTDLSEQLREQRRAAFLINLAGDTTDDGYFVPGPVLDSEV